jgi:dienelactone hydrolase
MHGMWIIMPGKPLVVDGHEHVDERVSATTTAGRRLARRGTAVAGVDLHAPRGRPRPGGTENRP